MSELNPDELYINLHCCQSSRDSKNVISSYMFNGETNYTDAEKQTPPKGKVKILICKFCGHRDFNDDGRFINEFSCNGCDGYVEVLFKKQ